MTAILLAALTGLAILAMDCHTTTYRPRSIRLPIRWRTK